MQTRPLPIPETKPALEFIDGHFVQKMSPYELHARTQLNVAVALRNWAYKDGRGRVGTEWDYDLTSSGEGTHRLVPDVAYLSYERLAYEDDEAAQVPTISPNVAVEILSHGQTLANAQRRVKIFLDCGAEVVLLINPRSQEAWLVDSKGTRHLAQSETIEHPALPGFSLPLRCCFTLVPPGAR